MEENQAHGKGTWQERSLIVPALLAGSLLCTLARQQPLGWNKTGSNLRPRLLCKHPVFFKLTLLVICHVAGD